MNTRNLLISVLVAFVLLLSACAPAATTMPTPLRPTQTLPTSTGLPATATLVSPADVLVDLSQIPDIREGVETISIDFPSNRGPLQAFDSIWFLMDTTGTVTRWDPETRQVLATIKVGDPSNAKYGDPVSAVATDDAVWVTSVATQEIIKVDPQTNQIVDRISLPKEQNLSTVVYMVAVGSTAWVENYDTKIAQGVDLNSKRALGTFSNVQYFSTFDGSLWILDRKGVAQIDPMTSQVLKQLPSGNPLPYVTGDGSMWGFDVGAGSISRMDLPTGEQLAKLKFGVHVRDLKFVNGLLWATIGENPPACHNSSKSLLLRIDPKTNTVTGEIALDCPFDIIPYKDSIWVVSGDESNLLLTHVQP